MGGYIGMRNFGSKFHAKSLFISGDLIYFAGNVWSSQCSKTDPTNFPTSDPTQEPTNNPTINPTMEPTVNPTKEDIKTGKNTSNASNSIAWNNLWPFIGIAAFGCCILCFYAFYFKRKSSKETIASADKEAVQMMHSNSNLFVKDNENESIQMNERVNSVSSVQKSDDDDKDLELDNNDLKLDDMYIDKKQPGSIKSVKYENVIDEQPNISVEIASVEMLKKWRLEQYVKPLIEDGGYEDIDDWKDLTLDDLKRLGFKEGHALKFSRKMKEEFKVDLKEEFGGQDGGLAEEATEGDALTQITATKGQETLAQIPAKAPNEL